MRAADENGSLAPPAKRLAGRQPSAIATVNQEEYLELVRRGREVTTPDCKERTLSRDGRIPKAR